MNTQRSLLAVCAALLVGLCACAAEDGAPSPFEIAPGEVELSPQQTTQFTALVSGASSLAVAWSVAEAGGGTIAADGLYQAPATAGVYTVVATSAANPGKSGRATVTVTAPSTGTRPTGSPAFALMSEMYGDAGSTAQQRLDQGLLNGVTFHPSLTSSEQSFLQSTHAAFGYFAVPAEANIGSCYPSASDSGAGTLLTTLTQQLGPKVWRVGMPEFDQGGGCWATGRPGLGGMSDSAAYAAWTGFYLDTKQLRPYLSQTAAQRGYKWLSVCSFAFCTQYAFDMGSDAVLLERNEDEMSGITPGLAMVRGAAKQHGDRDWGIDFSTWRYWNDGPTVYSAGRLVTGWSTATYKRNLFISYMGGANIIHNEAADYTSGAASGASLNPLGQSLQSFNDFAVKRHPGRGTPWVPMAIMQEHASGLEPKFGEWMQGDSKWYWTNGYTQGDRTFANLLALAYPGYASWGKLGAGAPKVLNSDGSINISSTQASYRQALANGSDPRAWEPMGTSRWGETFDVVTNQASLAAMQHYRAIVLATGTPMSDALVATLTQYAQTGGIVVMDAKQLGANAEALAGVHLTGGRASATSATWTADGSVVTESAYNYAVATTTTASVIAQASGNPVITRNAVGTGAVYVVTPDLMSDASGARALNVVQKLIDGIQAQLSVVQVSGPALEWLVATDGGRTIVTLVNTDLGGAAWTGTLSFPVPASSYTVKEWTGDTTVASSTQNGRVVVSATVPAFDVRVYVLDAP